MLSRGEPVRWAVRATGRAARVISGAEAVLFPSLPVRAASMARRYVPARGCRMTHSGRSGWRDDET
ncbi:hypothetical protein SSP35_19_00800 [Streptomyces sp. NBRC 110611]|nr:hypothetical protein SSP35_19_00800 [Streptomyces sp. NBRC 110611]